MKTMVISIRNTTGVRCREVVRFSEGRFDCTCSLFTLRVVNHDPRRAPGFSERQREDRLVVQGRGGSRVYICMRAQLY